MNAKNIDRISRYLTFFIPIKSIRHSLRENVRKYFTVRSINKLPIKQIKQIVDHNKFVFGVIGIQFERTLFQRPQQIATAIKKQNYECLYFDDGVEIKRIGGIHIFDYRMLYKIPECITRKIHIIFPSAISLTGFKASDYILLKKMGYKIVYEYIDAFDDKICDCREQLAVFNLLKAYSPDFFLATAKSLYNQLHDINKRIPIILNTNGVDVNVFFNVDDSIPGDICSVLSLRKKIIGYYGAIAPWLDFNLLDKVTSHLPEYNFVFIGPNYGGALKLLNRIIKKKDNVHYFGPKKYTELPHYSKYFDICIIPFETGEIAKSTSPLKLFEFMAAGKPCVCTRDLDECKGYDGVLIAEDSDDFIEKIKAAMELSKNDTVRERLYEYVRSAQK